MLLHTLLLGFAFVALSDGNVRGRIDQGWIEGGRIVGGNNVEPGKYPFMVSIQSELTDGLMEHHCGGVVISERYVMSTVVCVNGLSGNGGNLSVVVGTNSLSAGGSRHAVLRVVEHEDFQLENSNLNDIALVEVTPPLPLGPLVQAAELPPQDEATPPGTPATLLGWGTNETMAFNHDLLQEVQIEVRDLGFCDNVYYDEFFSHVYASQICADVPEGGKGTCFGDRGGPLIADGVVVGLASWWYACSFAGFPTVFTRVAAYRDWIELHAGL